MDKTCKNLGLQIPSWSTSTAVQSPTDRILQPLCTLLQSLYWNTFISSLNSPQTVALLGIAHTNVLFSALSLIYQAAPRSQMANCSNSVHKESHRAVTQLSPPISTPSFLTQCLWQLKLNAFGLVFCLVGLFLVGFWYCFVCVFWGFVCLFPLHTNNTSTRIQDYVENAS